MNCRQCGLQIPERYLTLDSFSCPRCRKTYYKRTPSAAMQRQRPIPMTKQKKVGFLRNRNLLLLIAFIIGIIYVIAQFNNISSASNYVATVNPETADELGSAIGTAIGVGLLMPHVVLTTIAVVFNGFGWFLHKRWAALTAAILYAVGGALGFINFFFVLPSMILCFVAASKLKKERR